MWTYKQSSGQLLDAKGTIVAAGYSGTGAFKNVPAAQNDPNEGPIPQGSYTIGQPEDSPTHGLFAIPLTPATTNEMFGRSGFMMHGDSKEHPGFASEGCIILPHAARIAVWYSKDHTLTVVAGDS